MNVLLTGATGFLGYRTLEKLIESNEITNIVATGRNLPEYRRLHHSKLHYKLGDLEDAAFVHDLTKNVDVIINTASLSSPWGSRHDFIKANLHTQTNLLEAANAQRIDRFIYISSPSIYYNGNNRVGVKESDPLPSTFVNEYARTKFEAEQLLVDSKIPFVILRPRALIGRGDSIIMPRLIQAFDKGRLKVIGNGNNIVDLTSVSNAADAILLALKAEGNALNQVYNITNGEPVHLWHCVSTVLKALNRELRTKKVPFLLVDTLALLMELRSKLTDKKEPTLTRYGVGTLAKSFTLDISKAAELLGYKPQMNTEAAMLEFIQWYKEHENL